MDTQSAVEVEPVARTVARHGDDLVTAAFEAHRNEIFTLLNRSTRSDAEAEDLLQETFIRLAREVRAGRAPEQVRAWLYRVAANLATSRSRRRAVASRWLARFGRAEAEPRLDHSPEALFVESERTSAVEFALGTLSTEARLALLMAAQGYSGREIAGALGRSEVATRAMMCRARLRVRAELEKDRS